MASSTSARTAFMAGTKLPPDDTVSCWFELHTGYARPLWPGIDILASVVSLCSYVMLSLQDQPRPCSENWPVLAVMWDLGMVQPSVSITKYLNVFYDQVYSIRYVESIWVEYGHMTDMVIWLARLFWEPVKYPKIISLTDRLILTFIAYSMKCSEIAKT